MKERDNQRMAAQPFSNDMLGMPGSNDMLAQAGMTDEQIADLNGHMANANKMMEISNEMQRIQSMPKGKEQNMAAAKLLVGNLPQPFTADLIKQQVRIGPRAGRSRFCFAPTLRVASRSFFECAHGFPLSSRSLSVQLADAGVDVEEVEGCMAEAKEAKGVKDEIDAQASKMPLDGEYMCYLPGKNRPVGGGKIIIKQTGSKYIAHVKAPGELFGAKGTVEWIQCGEVSKVDEEWSLNITYAAAKKGVKFPAGPQIHEGKFRASVAHETQTGKEAIEWTNKIVYVKISDEAKVLQQLGKELFKELKGEAQQEMWKHAEEALRESGILEHAPEIIEASSGCCVVS